MLVAGSDRQRNILKTVNENASDKGCGWKVYCNRWLLVNSHMNSSDLIEKAVLSNLVVDYGPDRLYSMMNPPDPLLFDLSMAHRLFQHYSCSYEILQSLGH